MEIKFMEKKYTEVEVVYSLSDSVKETKEFKEIEELLDKDNLTPEELEKVYKFCNVNSYDTEVEDDFCYEFEPIEIVDYDI